MAQKETGAMVLPMTEPIPVQDVLISGRYIQDCGEIVRMIAYLDRPGPDGTMERRWQASWICTKSDYKSFLRDIAPLVLKEMGYTKAPRHNSLSTSMRLPPRPDTH